MQIKNLIRQVWILTFFMILLQSCGPNASSPSPIIDTIPTATLTPSPTLPSATETVLPTTTFTPVPTIARVLIVTFDGLRPDAIAEANMENVLALMQAGAFTLSAQTIMP
ncbi:MAG TPA: hypothetical protein VFI68_07285, partial [Anaerolineales bacterium]|nr:hypothetical protein [Anaerolineales bacterium]